MLDVVKVARSYRAPWRGLFLSGALALLGSALLLPAARATPPAPTWQVQSDYFGERNAIAQPRTIRGLALSHDESSLYLGNIQSPNTGSTAIRKVSSAILATPGTDHVIFGNGMPGGTGTFGQVAGQPVYAGGATGTFHAWMDVGNSPESIDTDDRGYVYVALQSGIAPADTVVRLSGDLTSQVELVPLPAPTGVAVRNIGGTYYAYTASNSGLARYDVTSLPATLDPSWAPGVIGPRGLAVDADGTVFAVGPDLAAGRVYRIDPSGSLTHDVALAYAADVAIFQDKIYIIKRQSPTQPIVVLNKADLTSAGPDLVIPELGPRLRGSICQLTSIDVSTDGRLFVSEENYTAGSNGVSSYTPPATTFNPTPGTISGRIYFDRILVSSPLPDEVGPVITCPGDVAVNNDLGLCAASLNPGTATAIDDVDGPRPVSGTRSDSLPLTDPYPVGTTTILWSASDLAGNTTECTQTIEVTDAELPQITCPADITAGAASPAGVAVTFADPAVSDNCAGVGLPSCDRTSGDTFTPGIHTVNCSVMDAAGNVATCSFTVTVTLGSPMARKEAVRDDLVAVLAGVTHGSDRKKLQDAINKINKSLEASRWLDGSHPKPGAKGEGVFNEERGAVVKLRELRNANSSGLSFATMQAFIDRLVQIDRDLATTAIDEALARIGNAGKISNAQSHLTKGDNFATSDKADKAIEEYREAWKDAISA